MWVALSATTAEAGLPTLTVGGSVVGQVARSAALQVALSIIETVAGPFPLSWLGT